MKKVLVFYHSGCTDGFSSAWAAWKKFGDKAEYYPAKLEEKLSVSPKNSEVFTLDFVPPNSVLETLKENGNTVTVIDHHVSNEPRIRRADHSLFNLDHSGAVLSWKYFHPDKKVPKLLQFVQDADLWQFKLKKTKQIQPVLEGQVFSFKLWDKLAKEMESEVGLKRHVSAGEVISKYQDKLVQEMAQDAEPVLFEGIKTLAVNSSVCVSKLGAELSKRLPPMAIVWTEARGIRKFSLRSQKSYPVDVSKFAKKYGGGGHKSSAGFKMTSDKEFPWKTVNSRPELVHDE